jgi:probable DNA repair protein
VIHSELGDALNREATLITANRRLARTLHAAYAAQRRAAGARAWPTPDILPLAGWVERVWLRLLMEEPTRYRPCLNPAQQASLWEQVIARHHAGAVLLRPAAAAEAAIHAWELVHQWRVPGSGNDAWRGHPDGAVFIEWSELFAGSCADVGREDPARIADQVLAAIRSGLWRAPEEVWMAGFDALTPLQRDLFSALEAAGSRVRAVDSPATPGAAAAVAFPDPDSQWEAIARWASNLVDRDPEPRLGIVVPRLESVRAPLVRALTKHVDDAFHVSLGPPLAHRPVIAAALTFGSLLQPRLELTVISRVLLSPFLGGAAEEWGARARFDLELRRQGLFEVSWKGLAAHPACPPQLARSFRRVSALNLPERQSPSRWSRALAQLLDALGWPGGRTLSSAEQQIVQAWREALSELATLDLTLPSISGPAAAGLLEAIAARPFEPEDQGQPVQVLGVLEAAGSTFDHLWLAGFDDAAWPPPPSPHPFVPIVLQRACGIPQSAPGTGVDHARLLTRRLLASAPLVTVSWLRSDGERTLGLSPLMTGLPRRASGPDLIPRIYRQDLIEEVDDTPPPPLEPGAPAAGGTRALQLQALCPFRAFAEIRLHALPLEEPDLGLDPRERGTLLHAALDHCWRELGGSEALRQPLEPVVDRAVSRALSPTTLDENMRELERSRLRNVLLEWLGLERQREIPFQADPGEQRRDIEIGDLSLRTRLDRQDRLTDGRLILIDYKSGDPAVASWDGDRPDEPQLPLYAVTSPEPLAGVAFAQVRSGDVRFRGFTTIPGALPGTKQVPASEFQRQLDDWRRVLESLATEFGSGGSAVDPKSFPETCQHCHLASLCRVHEFERTGSEV